jgi:hypothetical protein
MCMGVRGWLWMWYRVGVRYCRINTTPHMERIDLLEIQTAGLSPPQVREQQLG